MNVLASQKYSASILLPASNHKASAKLRRHSYCPSRSVAAYTLKLYVAKKNGAWVTEMEALQLMDVTGFQPLKVARATIRSVGLSDSDVDQEVDQREAAIAKGPVHVLVATPSSSKKQRLEWRSKQWGTHAYDPNSPFFRLNQEDTAESGLPSTSLLLSCRPKFHQQFEFLQDAMLEQGGVGWILGQPGTGKSTTAMAFATTIDRDQWTVTWTHLVQYADWVCMRLAGGECKTCTTSTADMEDVLRNDDSALRHLVLFDSWTERQTAPSEVPKPDDGMF